MNERVRRDDPPFEAECLDEETLHRYVEGELPGELAREVDRAAKRSPALERKIAGLVRERVELTELFASLGAPERAPDLPSRFATRIAAQAARERAARRRSIYARRLLHAIPAALVALAFIAPGSDRFGDRPGEPESSTAIVAHGATQRVSGKGESAEPAVARSLDGGAKLPHAGAQASPHDDLMHVGADVLHVSYEPLVDFACVDGDEPRSLEDGIDPVFPPSVLVCKSCVAPIGSEPAADRPASTRVARRVERAGDGDPIGYVIRHAQREHEQATSEPCPPDPNADGVFDASDFVYVLQHEFSVAYAAPIERTPPPSTEAADQREGCEEEDAPATNA